MVDLGLDGKLPWCYIINVKQGCHMKQTSSTNVVCDCASYISTILNEVTFLDVHTFKLIFLDYIYYP